VVVGRKYIKTVREGRNDMLMQHIESGEKEIERN
jgi:hypothetical protein